MFPIKVQISDFIYREILNLKEGEGRIVEEKGSIFLKVGLVKIPVSKEANLPLNSIVRFSVVSSGEKRQIIIQDYVNVVKDRVEGTSHSDTNIPRLESENYYQVKGYEDRLQSIVNQIIKLNPDLKVSVSEISKILRNWFDSEISLGTILGRLEKMISELYREGILNEDTFRAFSMLVSGGRYPDLGEIKRWVGFYRENFEAIKKLLGTKENLVKSMFEGEIISEVRILKLLSQLADGNILAGIKAKGFEQEFKFLVGKLQEKLFSSQLFSLLSSDRFLFVFEFPLLGMNNNWVRIYLNTGRGNKRRAVRSDYNLVAISLNLEKMGRMWIELRNIGNYLSCYIKVKEDNTYKLINEKVEDLKEKMKTLDISDIYIYVDRLVEDETECVLNMLQSFSGLEMLV